MPHNETKAYSSLIEKCDSLIKNGQLGLVKPLLAQVNAAQVPREFRTPLAKLCRRSGLINLGLRLLQPILRNDQPLVIPATEAEICEYSVLLSRMGSIDEALELLSNVNPEQAPEALLYQGFCYVSKWDYRLARPFFENYLQSTADHYSKLIARVNLVAAYIATDELQAAELLVEETLAIAARANAYRLMGNCFELRAQVHIFSGKYEKARADLQSAQNIFTGAQSYDQLIIHKWQSIIAAAEQKTLEPILNFRQEAQAHKHWESVREADLFALKIRFDQGLFDRLVFGTPYRAYRLRVEHLLGGMPSQFFYWGDSSSTWLDLQTGKMNRGSNLNPGKKIHQVLAVLVKDFYAPRTSGALFAELYPGEYFDVNTSPLRIRQVLTRTRQWLKENHLPVAIEYHEGNYRMAIHGDFAIRISLEQSELNSQHVILGNIKANIGAGLTFTVQDAVSQLRLSRSAFHRFAEWAMKTGLLEKSGVGKATVYRLVAPVDGKSTKRAS